MIEPIIKTITVPCTPEIAFDVFTQNIGDWWPMETHAIAPTHNEKAVNVTIEPTVGGTIYETSNSGARYDWGKITAFERGKTFAMTWHLSNPPNLGTLITLTFGADADGGTRVVLQHDNWDALGDGAMQKRDQYNNGWIKVFEENYAAACQG